MKNNFPFHVSEVHAVKNNIALQRSIGDRAIGMGILPRPFVSQSVTFRKLAVYVFNIHESYVSLVLFAFLIEDIKYSACTCKTHDNGVYLVGNLADVA